MELVEREDPGYLDWQRNHFMNPAASILMASLLVAPVTAAIPNPTQVQDPYAGSGGLFLGTPSREDIESGRIDFTAERFAAFKTRTTTKAELAGALGRPAGWMTNPDGSSQLEYDYIETTRFMGMRQVMHTFFIFDPKGILVRVRYPGYDSDITFVTFDGQKFVTRLIEPRHFEFSPEGQEKLGSWSEMVAVNAYLLPRTEDPMGSIVDRFVKRYQENGKVIEPSSAEPSLAEKHVAMVLTYAKFQEAILARFLLMDGKAVGISYSHRVYGDDPAARMEPWIQANRTSVHAALNRMDPRELGQMLK